MLNYVLCKLFFKVTIFNCLQTSFNWTMKNWSDKYHMVTVKVKHAIFKTRVVPQLKGTYIPVLLQNTCRLNMSFHILVKGIHFVELSFKWRWNAYVAMYWGSYDRFCVLVRDVRGNVYSLSLLLLLLENAFVNVPDMHNYIDPRVLQSSLPYIQRNCILNWWPKLCVMWQFMHSALHC